MTFVEKIAAQLERRKANEAACFIKLARTVADGHEPSAEAAERVLRESGKTVEDLAQAVAQIEERRRLRARFDKAAGIADRKAQILAELDCHDAALRKAQEDHARQTGPLVDRLRELERIEADAESARSALQLTAIDPAIAAAIEAIDMRRRPIQEKRDGLQAQLARARERVSHVRWCVGREMDADGRTWSTGELAEMRTELDQLEKGIPIATSKLAELDGELSSLGAEIHAAAARRLDP